MAGPIETYRGRVAPQQCDHLGHMNIQFYVARISDATVVLNAAMGITASYVRTQRRALATIRQEISYLAELNAGDLIAMHSGVLAAEGKKVWFLHRMTRVEDAAPVMSAKVLMLGMDLERRKAIPVEEAILARAKAFLVEEILA